MADKITGVLASATSVLTRAVELDKAKRYTEASVCYQEGLQLLMDVLKACPADKKEGIREKIKQYMARAEELKKTVEKEKEEGKYHEQIQIENDSTGHSYERIFNRFLDENLTEVVVEDPYIRSNHQLYNFLRFCELLVKSPAKVSKICLIRCFPKLYNFLRFCELLVKSPAKVSKICLITGQDEHFEQKKNQERKLEELYNSLQTYRIILEVNYSNTLHDREIRLNNGWIIKIGRGLDIYKATDGKFCIGFCDYDLRKCHATTVDIFHSKHVNKTFAAS